MKQTKATNHIWRNAATGWAAAMLAVIAFGVGVVPQEASAQEQGRHTVEIGAVGQTTSDLITAPYREVDIISGVDNLGTPNQQGFGGAEAGYRYAFTRNFSLEGRIGYLLGHQPTVYLSGGHELMMHAGIRASVPRGRYSLFARVAPGLSSFSQAARYLPQGSTGRITHFSVEESAGVTYRLAARTALSFSVGGISLVEGDAYQGLAPSIPCTPANQICGGGGPIVYPGNVEEHLVADIGLERSFGRTFDENARDESLIRSEDRHVHNEVFFLWANQPQTYLSSGYLAASNGFGIDAVHSLRSWLDIDAAVLWLPGGDAATYQDGGSKTELFVGIKAGLRRRYYGVFGEFRPGLVTSPDTLDKELTPTDPYVRNFNFAVNAGAVVEVYPTASHFVMRFDLGEVGAHYAAVNVTTPYETATQPAQSRSEGLFTFGIGWRF